MALRGSPEVTLGVGVAVDGLNSFSLASSVWTAWGGGVKGGEGGGVKSEGWSGEGGGVKSEGVKVGEGGGVKGEE